MELKCSEAQRGRVLQRVTHAQGCHVKLEKSGRSAFFKFFVVMSWKKSLKTNQNLLIMYDIWRLLLGNFPNKIRYLAALYYFYVCSLYSVEKQLSLVTVRTRMEKTHTDYKRQTWNIWDTLFKMREPWRGSFKRSSVPRQ